MLREFIVFGCFAAIATAMLALDPGFQSEEIKWLQFVNQTRIKVQEELSKIFPNVAFKVFSVKDSNRLMEEFFVNRIKIVVDDNDIVVEAPVFFGQKPDFTFAQKLLGKKWKVVKDSVIKALPTATVVVEQNGKRISTHNDHGGNYVLIVADSDDVVNKMPEYVRVLPKSNS